MAHSVVQITTFSDADFAEAFQWMVNDVAFDFTDHGLMLMVRKEADDAEVFISLDSEDVGGIAFTPDVDDKLTTFNVYIPRGQMADMPPGDYVHSLIMVRPDGIHEDIWRGTLTHDIGPTR